MAEQKYLVLRIERSSGASSAYVTMTELACRCGVHPELIDRFMRLGLIDATDRSAEGEMLFPADVISMVRKIMRLRNELGVNYAGIGVVFELMARIEALESEIRELQREIDSRHK
jgi:DNA-binding transcriptional MerR regulator